MRKLNYNLENTVYQNLFLCDSAHLITLDINLLHTRINCCTAYHPTDATQNTLKCKYTPIKNVSNERINMSSGM
jgi:hypothetical protein